LGEESFDQFVIGYHGASKPGLVPYPLAFDFYTPICSFCEGHSPYVLMMNAACFRSLIGRDLVVSLSFECLAISNRNKIMHFVSDNCCRGFLDSNGNRATHSGATVSSSHVDEEFRGSGSKPKLGAIRHLISSSKFRNSLSLKKRRSVSLNSEKKLAQIVDVRDAKDLQAVDELRKELIARSLLPLQHDDYHILLRLVSYGLVPSMFMCTYRRMYLLLR